MKEIPVVTCFLEYEGKILLLHRSDKVGTYKGYWAGVSGYCEKDDPLDQAYIEISEEVSLDSDEVRLIKKGEALPVRDSRGDRIWKVYPFLFSVLSPDCIVLDWEHTECTWITPEEMADYLTVPWLSKTLAMVWPSEKK
jgi:8-oxo-dGTP pyrophosphatase MutT (NUDIX family)